MGIASNPLPGTPATGDRDMKVESVLMRGMFAMAALAVLCGIILMSLH
jgi:hypothetical protein